MSLRLRGATLQHGNGVYALRGVDLELKAGERVAIIGPSGSGKSSLLNLLGTAFAPSSGELEILGLQPWQLPARARQKLRQKIALIQQSPPLPPRQRVITAVLAGKLGQWSLARSLFNLLYPQDIAGAQHVLQQLDLSDKLFAQCQQLSGGQLQRVGIARALYQEAQVLLADEPVSAMDPVLAEHTLGLLNDYAEKRNLTLIASLHAVELALAHFPRIVGVRDGLIAFDCASSDVSAGQLAALYANQQLGGANVPSPAPSLQIPRC